MEIFHRWRLKHMWNWHSSKLALLYLCFVHGCVWCKRVSLWLLTSPDAAAPLSSSAGITSTLSPLGLSVTVPDQLLHTCRLRPVIFTGQTTPYVIGVSYGNVIRTPTAYAVINCRLDYFWLRHSWLVLTGDTAQSIVDVTDWLDILKQGSRWLVLTTEQMVHFNRSPHRSEVKQYLRLCSPFCLLFFLFPPYF